MLSKIVLCQVKFANVIWALVTTLLGTQLNHSSLHVPKVITITHKGSWLINLYVSFSKDAHHFFNTHSKFNTKLAGWSNTSRSPEGRQGSCHLISCMWAVVYKKYYIPNILIARTVVKLKMRKNKVHKCQQISQEILSCSE